MAQQILNTPRETTHQRIAAALEAIEQNMSDEHEAVNIDYDNTTSGLSANKVQSAIDELALAGFVTNTVNNLVNYYLKSETYNKAEVDSLINAVKNSRFEAVSTLPTTNIKTNVIYLVPKSPTQTNNAKDEYINLDGTSSGWEKIGDTEVDLSGYVTTTALNTALSNYTTTVNLTNLLNNKVDKETGKGLSTNDYTDTEKQKLSGIEAGANKTVVDSAMSDSSTNPLQNKVITAELQGAKTATGNPITVTDAAPVNAVNLSMDLEPVQDLHGYANPWVGGAGKNKLPLVLADIKAANTSGTWSGNVYSIGNRTFEILVDSDNNVIGIKANGTDSGNSQFAVGDYVSLPQNSYIMSASPSGGGTTTYQMFVAKNTSGSISVAGNDTGSGVQVSTDGVSTYRLWLEVRSGYNAQNLIFYPMIRLSTETDSSFAPYTNICPISGRSEENINDKGVNFWNEQWELGSYDANGGAEYANNKIRSKSTDFIKIDKGEPFYFECTSAIWLCFYTSAYQFISATALAESSTVNPPSNAEYIRFNCAITYGTTYKNDIFIGKKKTYTIQLGQTVYGCHYDVTRGKIVVTHGEVDLGDLNWGYNAQYSLFYSALSDGEKTGTGYGLDSALCSAYNVSTAVHRGINNGDISVGNNVISSATCGVVIKDSRYTDATAFKTAVTGQTLVYKLATPFTIPLTPQQIKMLENTNTIYTDYEGDTITLEYQPNNAIGEAVRVVEESYDPEFAVRPVLKKKAFSGTTDSDGAVTLINASDIPNNHRIIPLQITDMTIGGSAGTYFVEYEPYNSGDSVKGYCYFYMSGSQMFPVGKAITGNFYYYELER